jgi:hypothetical protein
LKPRPRRPQSETAAASCRARHRRRARRDLITRSSRMKREMYETRCAKQKIIDLVEPVCMRSPLTSNQNERFCAFGTSSGVTSPGLRARNSANSCPSSVVRRVQFGTRAPIRRDKYNSRKSQLERPLPGYRRPVRLLRRPTPLGLFS